MAMDADVGTHNGHLDSDARERRREKNARNARRPRGKNAPDIKRGSHRWDTRLWIMGNRQMRGTK